MMVEKMLYGYYGDDGEQGIGYDDCDDMQV